MPSPLSLDHGDHRQHARLLAEVLPTGDAGRPGAEQRLGPARRHGEPQPDVLFASARMRRPEPQRGRVSRGRPELVVAGTSRKIDLGPKFEDYRRAGVREYLVVAVDPGEVFWFFRRDDRLEALPPGPDWRVSLGGLPRTLARSRRPLDRGPGPPRRDARPGPGHARARRVRRRPRRELPPGSVPESVEPFFLPPSRRGD